MKWILALAAVLGLSSLAMASNASAHALATAGNAPHATVDHAPHPGIPTNPHWVGKVVMGIAGLFILAIPVGMVVRAKVPQDAPNGSAHEEPSGSAHGGQDHGHGGHGHHG